MITVPSPRFTVPCHWFRPTPGETVVFELRHWGLALQLTAAGGWSPLGTTSPSGLTTTRTGYFTLFGQTLETADAAALAAGLATALERAPTMTPADREATGFVLLNPQGGPAPWLAVTPGQQRNGGPVFAFNDLTQWLASEPGPLVVEESLTVRGLRRLVELLRRPGDVTLHPDAPVGWIEPGEPTPAILLRPRRHDEPARCGIGPNQSSSGSPNTGRRSRIDWGACRGCPRHRLLPTTLPATTRRRKSRQPHRT